MFLKDPNSIAETKTPPTKYKTIQEIENSDSKRPIEFENLQIIKRIGKGGFSEVFQAIDENTSKEYALRLCPIDNRVNYTRARAQKEISINETQTELNHPNIAHIYSSKIIYSSKDFNEELNCQVNFYLQVVMELGVCTLESVLKKRLKEMKPYSEIELLKIALMLINALVVAAKKGISHRDISLGNVVQDKTLKNYKIIDFGEALLVSPKFKTKDVSIVGKWKFMAPELKKLVDKIQLGEKQDFQGNIQNLYNAELADVYSLGIVLGNVALLGDFDGRFDKEEMAEKLNKIKGQYPRFSSQILCHMLHDIPTKRLTFQKLQEEFEVFGYDLFKFQFFEYEFDSELKLITTSSQGSIKTKNLTASSFDSKKPLKKSTTHNDMITYSSSDIDWARINPINRSQCETMDAIDWFKKGEFNMRNNLFGVAIQNFLKAYEILKRSDPDSDKTLVFEQILQISINMAFCQKKLLNYTEASNILRACQDSVRSLNNLSPELTQWYIYMCCELSEQLILQHNFQESNDIISEGLNMIKNPNSNLQNCQFFVMLVSYKAEILIILGYQEDAYKLYQKIYTIITTKLNKSNASNSSSKSTTQKSQSDITNNIMVLTENNYEILLSNCEYSLSKVDLLNSKFIEVNKKFSELKNTYNDIFMNESNQFSLRIIVDELKMNRLLCRNLARSEIISFLIKVYMQYDHIRLIKDNTFMEFLKEKALYNININRTDEALSLVTNYFIVLKNTAISNYWIMQFKYIQAICYRKSQRKLNDALVILNEVYEQIKASEKPLVNYLFLKEVMEEISMVYYEKGQYEKSVETLICIIDEYYNDKKIVTKEEFRYNVEYAHLNLLIGNMFRKTGDLEKCQEYLTEAETTLNNINFSEEDQHNFYYGILYKCLGKMNCSKKEYTKSLELIYKSTDIFVKLGENNGTFDFAVPYVISNYRLQGNIISKAEGFKEGMEMYKQAIFLSQNVESCNGYALQTKTLCDLASLCTRCKQYDLALEFLGKALTICKSNWAGNAVLGGLMNSHRVLDLRIIYESKANVYLKLDNFKDALKNYQLARDLNAFMNFKREADEYKHIFDLLTTIHVLGMRYIRKSDYNSAYIAFKECLELFTELQKIGMENSMSFMEKVETIEIMIGMYTKQDRDMLEKVVKNLNSLEFFFRDKSAI